MIGVAWVWLELDVLKVCCLCFYYGVVGLLGCRIIVIGSYCSDG